MLGDGWESFDYGNIHKVLRKSTLSKILTFYDYLQGSQLGAEMQIYVPVALPYRVQCLPLFKSAHQVPYGREYNADYNADYNAAYNADYNTKYNAEIVTKL